MDTKGIYKAQKTNGDIYYRVSVNRYGKHISLGSFSSSEYASLCYKEANDILSGNVSISDYNDSFNISFEKFVVLINLRDNRIYFSNPIYLKTNYFLYYLDPDTILKFDKDDLFFYSRHKIMKRGNHLFYSEYGMQVNLNERYGIMSYAVLGRDFLFKNEDVFDYRYSNIEIINRYYGVSKITVNGIDKFIAKIHINGYLKLGEYSTETEAAIAYNKAIDMLSKNNTKEYRQNDPGISPKDYATIYSNIKISDKIRKYI